MSSGGSLGDPHCHREEFLGTLSHSVVTFPVLANPQPCVFLQMSWGMKCHTVGPKAWECKCVWVSAQGSWCWTFSGRKKKCAFPSEGTVSHPFLCIQDIWVGATGLPCEPCLASCAASPAPLCPCFTKLHLKSHLGKGTSRLFLFYGINRLPKVCSLV